MKGHAMKIQGTLSGLTTASGVSNFVIRSSDGRDTPVQTLNPLPSNIRKGDMVEVEGDMPPDPPFLATSVTKLSPDNPSPSGAWKWFVLGALVLVALIGGYYWYSASQVHYFRLELKNGSRYLTADNCSNHIVLANAPNTAEPGCELWREVPDTGGYSRYQLKNTKLFLTVPSCLQGAKQAALAAKATGEDAPCQRWREVPYANGWSLLDLPAGKGYLDANRCQSNVLGLNPYPGSTFDDHGCQLWRHVPY
jgi:hypothetical protein